MTVRSQQEFPWVQRRTFVFSPNSLPLIHFLASDDAMWGSESLVAQFCVYHDADSASPMSIRAQA
jgi:hypothetical protein